MKRTEALVAYPITDLFTTLLDELVEEAENNLDIAQRLRTCDRQDEAFYDAMAELYAALSHLELHVPDTKKEMERLEELFPGED